MNGWDMNRDTSIEELRDWNDNHPTDDDIGLTICFKLRNMGEEGRKRVLERISQEFMIDKVVG